MWPASLRHGMITLVLGREAWKPGNRCGEGRATIPYISDSQSTPGSRPR